MKAAKFFIIGAFLFALAYMNKENIPSPTELKSYDFVTSGGIDIINEEISNSANSENSANSSVEKKVSVSYIIGDEKKADSGDNSGDSPKNIYNVKSKTLNSAFAQLQSLTNKSLNNSHLEYIIFGEQTAQKNLEYFIKNYAKNTSARLDANIFIAKDMTSEKFITKVLGSEIDVNARIESILSDKTQLSSLAGKDLKDLLQIFYSKNKTGLLPVLEITESPIKSEKSESLNETENKKEDEDKKYTFGFYGLGIIKNGLLVDYLEKDLVRAYVILNQNLKNSEIEIKDEAGNLSTFPIKNSKTEISFDFANEKDSKPSNVNFLITIDVNFDETSSEKNILNQENIPELSDLQSDVIKSEIEKIIEKSKKNKADFLNIEEIFAAQHPYKYREIKQDWSDIFLDLNYELNVNINIKRFYNINY